MSYGPKPVLDWLEIDKLYVDPRYQRSLDSRRSHALIGRIVDGFRWSRFGAALVTKTEQGFALLDGQHRTEAARRLKIKSVPCVIIDAASVEEQAWAFVGANRDRVAVNPFALHHAMVVGGDPSSVEIDQVCRAAGVEIPRYPIPSNKLKPNQTLAVGAIKRAIRLWGQNETIEGLRAIIAAAEGVPGCIRANLVSAVMELVHETGGASAIAATMRKIGIKKIDDAAEHAHFLSGTAKAATIYGILKAGRLQVGGPKSATKTFDHEVTRRCTKCKATFMTNLVAKTDCDGCAVTA